MSGVNTIFNFFNNSFSVTGFSSSKIQKGVVLSVVSVTVSYHNTLKAGRQLIVNRSVRK